MQISHIDNTYQKIPELIELSNIISFIRSDNLKQDVADIRNGVDNWTEIKLSLPMFYPNCNFDGKGRGKSNILTLTGLIQIDIDLKDQIDGFKSSLLKDRLISIPEVLYCFISPSGGIKAAILTNLDKSKICTELQSLQYHYTIHWLSSKLKMKIEYDDSVFSFTLGCYVSHDTACYYNPNATPLDVSKIKKIPRQPIIKKSIRMSSSIEVSYDLIEKIVSTIPSRLPDTGGQGAQRKARYPYNQVVIDLLGPMGVELMACHWNSDDSSVESLRKNYQSYLKSPGGGTIDKLIGMAYKFGYRYQPSTRGKVVTKQRTDIGNTILLKLNALPIRSEIFIILDKLLESTDNLIINLSLGGGKTYNVLRFFAKKNTRLIYLAPTKALCAQSRAQYEELRAENWSDCRKANTKPISIVIRSKDDLCINTAAMQSFGQNIPTQYCRNECPLRYKCKYTNQFKVTRFIRAIFIPNNQLYNEWSYFSHSPIKMKYPLLNQPYSSYGYKFNTVIIDENMIQTVKLIVEDSPFTLVKDIISRLDDNQCLTEIIGNYTAEIKAAYTAMIRKKPRYNGDIKEYMRARAEYKHCEILALMRDYVTSYIALDVHPLLNLNEDNKYFLYTPVVKQDFQYGKRVIILDATAQRTLIENIFPFIEFSYHDIQVGRDKDNPNRVIWNRKFRTSKTAFQKEYNLEMIADDILIRMGSQPAREFGIITYKSYKDQLSKMTGIPIENCGHFGGIAGQNLWSNLSLFCIGQLNVGGELNQLSFGLHGYRCTADILRVESKQIVRMSDQTAREFSMMEYQDDYMSITDAHFNISHTVQAWGRFRVFNYENTKSRVQVIYSDIAPQNGMEVDEVIHRVDYSKIGYCMDSRAAIMSFGMSRLDFDNNSYIEKFNEIGMSRYHIAVKTPHRKSREFGVFIYPDNDTDFNDYLYHNKLNVIKKTLL